MNKYMESDSLIIQSISYRCPKCLKTTQVNVDMAFIKLPPIALELLFSPDTNCKYCFKKGETK